MFGAIFLDLIPYGRAWLENAGIGLLSRDGGIWMQRPPCGAVVFSAVTRTKRPHC